MALTDDGRFLATTSEDKKIKLWDAESISPVGEVGSIDSIPSGLLWDTNQTTLTVSTLGGKIASFDTSALRVLPSSHATNKMADGQLAELPETAERLSELLEVSGRHSLAAPPRGE